MLVSYGARTARKSKRINQRMHLNLMVKYLAYRSSFLEMDLLIQVSESDDFDDITSIH